MRFLRSVFEECLRKDTSDGSDLSGITIKFAFAALPSEGADADQLQAAAIDQVTEAIGTLSSTPVAADLLASAVDTGTTVVTEVQTFKTTWSVLLKRLELFNKIVTDIGEVIGVQPPASLAYHLNPIDSLVCVVGLVSYIGREQCLSLSQSGMLPLLMADALHRCS